MSENEAPRPSGLPQALGAYVVWGFMPLYLLLVKQVPAFEFVGWRIVWTVRVGRSGDSDRERRVAPLLATSGVDCTVKVCRETRRARRQRRAQAEPQPDYLPIVLREDAFDGLFLNCEMTTNDYE